MAFLDYLASLIPGPWRVWRNFIKPVFMGDDSQTTWNTLGQIGDNVYNKLTGAGLTGEQEAQNQFAHDEAELAYNREVDAYKHQLQWRVADARAAGVNPVAAIGAGMSIPSAPAASPASGNNGFNMSDLLQLVALKPQIDAMKSQKDLLDSETANRNADTANKLKDLEWKDTLNTLQKHYMEGVNRLNRDQRLEIYERLNNLRASTKKLSEEADTEESKRANLIANAILSRATAEDIYLMESYRIAMLQADTDARRAQAACDWMQYSINNQLKDAGYFLGLAKEAGYKGDMQQFQTSLRNGTLFGEHGFAKGASVFLSTLVNAAEIIGVPAAGVAAAAIGGKSRRAAAAAGASARSARNMSDSYDPLWSSDWHSGGAR